MFIIYGSRSGSSISKKFRSWILWLRMSHFQKMSNHAFCIFLYFELLTKNSSPEKKVKNMKKIIFCNAFLYTFLKIRGQFYHLDPALILNPNPQPWIENDVYNYCTTYGKEPEDTTSVNWAEWKRACPTYFILTSKKSKTWRYGIEKRREKMTIVV